MATQAVPFTLLTVFASTSSCGNPAAVVFLSADSAPPDSKSIQWPASETLQGIAANLNQPITVFISPRNPAVAQEASFDVRWFTSMTEVRINGHGSIAAASAPFKVRI